jgi:hypothetical protein
MSSETLTGPRTRTVWLFVLVLFIVAALAVVITAPQRKADEFTWMMPAQAAQAMKPGKFTMMKYRILRWPGPWRWFARRKPAIAIGCQVLASKDWPNTADNHSWRTNVDGQLGKVLIRRELADWKEAFKSHGSEARMEMHITTSDGGQATITDGTTSPAMPAFCGLTLSVLPAREGNSFRLLLSGTWTEATSAPSDMGIRVRTNMAIACRAIAPNGGAVLMQAADQTNWWLISCVAVDSKGNPIGLAK